MAGQPAATSREPMRILIPAFAAAAVLAAAAPALAQSRTGTTSANDPNRLICRRMPETGSLAQTRRQCFTRAEWDRIAQSQRTGAERMIGELSTRPAGE